MKMIKREEISLSLIILSAIMCVYWVAILCINFSGNPNFYCTDMYADMQYAVEAWTCKQIFPDGWIFGNQLYVVATPVLAALFYGITQNPCSAMGIASSFMALGVVVSFYWMIKPMFKTCCERMLAVVTFMTVILMAGDPVYAIDGWQLFFTMCSYYACYAVTAFLAFGCYLRSDGKWKTGDWLALAGACMLSFGTGIQSLRQTAAMTLPLVAVELTKILRGIMAKRTCFGKSTWIACSLSVFNLAGVVFVSFVEVEKNEIFGSVSLDISSSFLENVVNCTQLPFLLFPAWQNVAMILFGTLCVYLVITVFRKYDWVNDRVFLFAFLCIVSAAIIWSIDVFTPMQIWEKYYFLLYPLTAVCITAGYVKLSKVSKTVVILAVILIFFSCRGDLQRYLKPQEEDYRMQQLSDYVEEQGFTTLYSHWNFGEKVAIASDFRIQAGFWKSRRAPFHSVKYLCNPSVFDTDAANCAYLVCGQDVYERTSEAAKSQGISIQILRYFPELDAYLFIAEENLMQ